MAELRLRTSNSSVVLPTYRDALALRVREDDKRKYKPSNYIFSFWKVRSSMDRTVLLIISHQ